MTLNSLQISGFRNLAPQELDLSGTFHFAFGENGSGKTSFLEAIFMLIRGRSFRSPVASHAINFNADSLTLFGRFSADPELAVGLSIGRKFREHKLDGARVSSSLPVTQLLPIMAIHSATFSMLDATSRYRRQILDWGVFHVEPAFLELWRQYGRLLSQRNALLRRGAELLELETWDRKLADCGNQLTLMRYCLIDKVSEVFESLARDLIKEYTIKIVFNKGWTSDVDMFMALNKSYTSDTRLNYTQVGPHRADFHFSSNGRSVKTFLSRGQIRLLTLTFVIAIVTVTQQLSGKSCLLLVDDLASELDAQNFYTASKLLINLGVPVFMTGVEMPNWFIQLPITDPSLFHVERGLFSKA